MHIKFFLIFSGLVLLSSPCPAQKTALHKYWIFFKDKKTESHTSPVLVTKTALRHLSRGTSVMDATDFPVTQEYVEQITRLGIVIKNISRWLNAATVYATLADSTKIARLGCVEKIEPVNRYKIKPVSAPLQNNKPASPLGASDYGAAYPQVAQIHVPEIHDRGYHGEGVLIGVLDSGFRLAHKAFRGIKIRAQYDFVRHDAMVANEPNDHPQQDYHGTEVLSLLAGNDSANFRGTVFQSEFVLAKTEIVDSEIVVEEDNWVCGLEWAESLGVDMVTSSLGYVDWYTYADMNGHTALCTQAATLAVRKGVCVVVAAGNEGTTAWHYITAPADGESVIAVGAVNLSGLVPAFSSRGPTADGRIKPDMAACGEGCFAADPSSVTGYIQVNGTSMATPLVAGACALLLQIHPDWNPAQVMRALKSTASQSTNPDNIMGWGIINAYAASELARITTDNTFNFECTISPVPIRNQASIHIIVPYTTQITLSFYNSRGALVHNIDLGTYQPGNHTLRLNLQEDPTKLISGLYFVQIKAGTKDKLIKFLLVE